MLATFVHDGLAIDYTPTTNVAAGSIVVLGKTVGIARVDIPADTLGSLAVVGVYDVEKGETAFAAGDAVYWNMTTEKAVSDASAKYLGRAVEAASAGNPFVRVRLEPVAVGSVISETTPAGTVLPLTDSTGGVSSNTIAAAASTDFTKAELDVVFASFAAKINAIIAALIESNTIASGT